jgi:membrane protease YdiL (CAAX protease family)
MITSESLDVRLPKTWEANLLVALLLPLIAYGAVLVTGLGLSSALLIPQLVLVLPCLLWMVLRRYPFRQTLRLEPLTGRLALWSAAVGLACYPVVVGLASLIELALSRIGPGPQTPAPSSALDAIAYAVVLILVAPITEEPIFRGFVMSAWLRRGTVPGLVLSAFLFASIHFQIVALLPIGLLGVVFAVLVQRTGSIYSSMIAHACYNALGTLFILLPTLRRITEWPLIAAGCIALPVAFLLLRSFARRYPPLPSRLPAERTPRIWVILSLLVVVLILALVGVVDIYVRLNPTGFGA